MSRTLALSGGVGGAKLCLGLYRALPPDSLSIVANTGDDFELMGLHISPDLDTVAYTLAGLASESRGWGLEGETWQCMEALERLGGETWFRLGDRDLATHLRRSAALNGGEPLSAVTRQLCSALGVQCELLPMSDDPVRTVVISDEGDLPFQRYFVERRCEPAVTGFRFDGMATAQPLPRFMELLAPGAVDAVVICPSNPFVSVDPILDLPGVREALAASPAPVIAVSPLVGGRALKGPLAKMMGEMGLPVTAEGVAARYRGLVDGFVLDERDATLASGVESLGMKTAVLPTIMNSLADREVLARAVLDFAGVAG